MPARFELRLILGLFLLGSSIAFPESLSAADAKAKPADDSQVLVTVNGEPVTQADLDFAYLTRGITNAPQAARKQILETLINQRLIAAFLAQKEISAPTKQLEESVLRAEKLILKQSGQSESTLKETGFSPHKLREAIEIPLAWNQYAKQTITADQIRAYFDAHREELDGTRVDASHILLKLPPDADKESVQQAKQKLATIRDQIRAGKLTFSEAASQHSEAPSKSEGGKLVTSAYRGKMPVVLTEQIFPLKPGDISEPFQTPFGIHIVILNEKHPGQFSLEDVRNEIFKTLSRALWDRTIRNLRETAKIEWKTDSQN